MCTSIVFTLTMDVTPVSHRFSSYGVLATLVFVVGAIGPSVVGAVSDAVRGGAAGIRTGFFCLIPASFLAVILYGINWKFYPRESQLVSDTVMAEKK